MLCIFMQPTCSYKDYYEGLYNYVVEEEENPPKKRLRGRMKGSKNIPKTRIALERIIQEYDEALVLFESMNGV